MTMPITNTRIPANQLPHIGTEAAIPRNSTISAEDGVTSRPTSRPDSPDMTIADRGPQLVTITPGAQTPATQEARRQTVFAPMLQDITQTIPRPADPRANISTRNNLHETIEEQRNEALHHGAAATAATTLGVVGGDAAHHLSGPAHAVAHGGVMLGQTAIEQAPARGQRLSALAHTAVGIATEMLLGPSYLAMRAAGEILHNGEQRTQAAQTDSANAQQMRAANDAIRAGQDNAQTALRMLDRGARPEIVLRTFGDELRSNIGFYDTFTAGLRDRAEGRHR